MGKTMNEKKKVLFVDDNPMDRLILNKILTELDLEYKETTCPQDFLKSIKEFKPDLCLVDLNILQANDGSVLIKAIRNILGENLPIIIISAIEDSKDILFNLKNGANDYVCKPIDKSLLSSKVSNFLSNSQISSRILPLFSFPGHLDNSLEILTQIKITSIEQTGISFTSDLEIQSGQTIRIKNDLLKDVFDNNFLRVKIYHHEYGHYKADFCEISEEDILRLRLFISKMQKTN